MLARILSSLQPSNSTTLNTPIINKNTGKSYLVHVVTSQKQSRIATNGAYIPMNTADRITENQYPLYLKDKNLGIVDIARLDEQTLKLNYILNIQSQEYKHVGMALIEFACRIALAKNQSKIYANSITGSSPFLYKMGFRFEQSSLNKITQDIIDGLSNAAPPEGVMWLQIYA